MISKNEKNGFLFNLLLITIFFNIWFPKAGIKISGIPLTAGNVFLGLTFVVWFFLKLKDGSIKKTSIGFVIFYCIIYCFFKYIFIGDILLNVGYIIPLCIYPLSFYLTFDIVDSKEKVNKVIEVIVGGFFFICLYALLQFFVGIENCTIPGLTVNYSDFKEFGRFWFLTKSNGTDKAMAKIISTYQNGNLFGVNTLLFYPLVYSYLKNNERNNRKLVYSLILFIITVFLSLSRACWLGILIFLIFVVLLEKNNKKSGVAFKLFVVFIGICSIFLVFNFMPSVSNRFFGTKASDWVSMSGRTEGLFTVLKTVGESNSILALLVGPEGVINYQGLAYEMFPLAVFAQIGILGLIFMYMIFYLFLKIKNNNLIIKSIKTGIIIWLIVGIIECGYWLPPFALNLFMLIGLGMSINNLYKE